MAVLRIVRLGHPALRTPAEPLPAERLGETDVAGSIDDMIETLRASGGVGLAAPQVDLPWQLFVYEPKREAGEEGELPIRVVVNPMITPLPGELVYDWEGCLSIPDLRGLVPRHPGVGVRGLDRRGKPLDYTAHGYEARVIQHEYDHLNGVVFLDRMRDFRSLSYLEEWQRYLAEGGERESAGEEGSGA